MKIIGVGIDIVSLRRVREARFLERAAEFFFLPDELAQMRASRDRAQFVASRLALKEAIIKSYPGELHYHDIRLDGRGGNMSATFTHGSAPQYEIFVSLAHEFDYAVAYATLCV